MRHLFYPCIPLAVVLLLLTNCKPNPAKNTSIDASALEGFWVNDAWWQELQRTHSPFKAKDKGEVSSVTIQQDSGKWVAAIVYSWHEGAGYVMAKAGPKFQLLDEYNNNSVEYELTAQPDGSIHLDTIPFVRLGSSQNGYDAIAASLFAGTYTLEGQAAPVVFHPDRTVTGLNGYSRYDLVCDYIFDDLGADEIILSAGEDTFDYSIYEIRGNQLHIFSIETSEESEEYQQRTVGKIKYVLTRQ